MSEPPFANHGSVPRRSSNLASLWRLGLCALLIGLCGSSCASTVKQAAREAAPAAVKEGVEQAQKPDTRANVAELLADPRIRDATSALSEAVVQGMLDGLTDAEHSERLQRLTDALVSRAGASLARSFRTQLGPEIAQLVAATLDESLERMLDQRTEQRMQALAALVARSTVQGMSEALLDSSGAPTPLLRQAFGQVVHEAGYQAAFGFEHAVQDARDGVGPEANGDHSVLATLGRFSDWSRGVPLLLLSGLGLLLVALAAGLAWAVVSLRRLKRSHAG